MKINDTQPYIIAETAYNHEGHINYLYRMIDEIAELELNAIKFHLLLNVESYVQKNHPLIAKIKQWIFTEDQWSTLISYSTKKKLEVIALCDDVESIEYVIKNSSVAAIEIHATGINDFFLLKKAAEFKDTIILGVGGSTLDEISYAIELLQNNGKQDILLMYGFQSYPTDYSYINLSKILKLKSIFNFPVGYADHTDFNDPNNEFISVIGGMLGSRILEKHYTLDYGKERIDYHAAVGKTQMNKIKESMRVASVALGNGSLKLSKPELAYGDVGPMKKAIVAKKDIKQGEELSYDNLWFKRTEERSYVNQNQFLQLIGLKTACDIKKDEIISFSKLTSKFKGVNVENLTHIRMNRK